MVTEGGAAEEASSPLDAEEQSGQQAHQQQQPEAVGMAATASIRPISAGGSDAEDMTQGISFDHFKLPKLRPLSGSTIGSSSTGPTAIGSSAIPSKRQSTGLLPREEGAPQGGVQVNTTQHTRKTSRISDLNPDSDTITAVTTLANLSKKNAPSRQMSSTLPGGHATQCNPALANTNQPAEANNNNNRKDEAPLNIGCLKRTISTLTFDDLTPETRTAYPASEAPETPPAYARPRSEVGLPPLLPGVKEDSEMEDAEDGDEGEEGPRRRSRERERGFSAQEYLRNARMGFSS